MKGVLTIALLIVLKSTISIEAQEIKYGFMAGLCLPNLSLRNVSKNESYSATSSLITTYHINGFVTLRSDSWWEVSIEPGFIMKGGHLNFRYTNNPDPFYYWVEKHYSIVELPILWNAHLNQKFYLSTGLGFDYIAAIKNDQSWVAMGTNHSIGTILPDIEKRFNCSAIVGISYDLSDLLDIGIRYQLGLTRLMRVDLIDAINYPYSHPAAQSSIYSNCLQLSLKYKIN